MSDDAGVSPMERQAEIVAQMAQLISNEVEGEWLELKYTARKVAPWGQDITYVTRPNGEVVSTFPPRKLFRLVNELRKIMYRPDAGTWFSMWIEIDTARRVSSKFDYDNEPAWTRPADPLVYFEDLQKYPRDSDHTPIWLAEKVALGKADFDRHHYADGTPRR